MGAVVRTGAGCSTWLRVAICNVGVLMQHRVVHSWGPYTADSHMEHMSYGPYAEWGLYAARGLYAVCGHIKCIYIYETCNNHTKHLAMYSLRATSPMGHMQYRVCRQCEGHVQNMG